MKFNSGTLSQEGFESGFVLVLENGLVLKSKSVLWAGSEEKNKVKKQFEEFVDALKNTKIFEPSSDVQTE